MRFTPKDIQRLADRGMIKADDAAVATKAIKASRGSVTAFQDQLTALAFKHFADYGPEAEYKHLVPGRRFRADVCFPDHNLILELDGWSHHARFKANFKQHTERQNLLQLHGWIVLRYTPGMLKSDPSAVIDQIQQALNRSNTTRVLGPREKNLDCDQ